MRKITGNLIRLSVGILIFLILGLPVFAENYPGVYSSDETLIFVQSGDSETGLEGIVVLSWEFSMDWIITTAVTGTISENGITLIDGNQYVYQADGQRDSMTQFTSLEMAEAWDNYEYIVMPSYGYLLAPMLRGGLAYALVETRAGLPAQLVLASEAFETEQTINLFEGFLYQLSGGEMNAQVAFTEVAFGNQGLVHANFPDNFPPPPEDYPYPYPEYPVPSYPPPVAPPDYAQDIYNPPVNINDPTLPQGTPVDGSENRPRFTLEPVHDYTYSPIVRLGVVAFEDTAELRGYGPVSDDHIQDILEGNENIEVVYIPWDSAVFGGAVYYDRAVWLCEQYGVDAIMLSELDELDIPGGSSNAVAAGSFRVNVEINSSIIEGTGGSVIWEQEFLSERIHDAYEIQNGREDSVLSGDIFLLIRDLVDDIEDSGVLDGGYVE